jgi:type IV pilus biogenesis protein CpaD/CtpE
MSPRRFRFPVLLTSAILALGGCAATEPWEAQGGWHPRGVNDGNLAAMIADPNDLVRGRGTSMSDGTLAAAAVDRLYTGKAKVPPTSSISTVGTTSPSVAAGGSADNAP